MQTELIREYIREVYKNEELILNEGVAQKAVEWIKEKGTSAVSKLKQFFMSLKSELEETGYGALVLKKLAMGENLELPEAEFLKGQIKDVAKGGFLAGLFILPGGGLASAALVKIAKKYNFDLMPSSFSEQKKG
jgi:hypothetical protein